MAWTLTTTTLEGSHLSPLVTLSLVAFFCSKFVILPLAHSRETVSLPDLSLPLSFCTEPVTREKLDWTAFSSPTPPPACCVPILPQSPDPLVHLRDARHRPHEPPHRLLSLLEEDKFANVANGPTVEVFEGEESTRVRSGGNDSVGRVMRGEGLEGRETVVRRFRARGEEAKEGRCVRGRQASRCHERRVGRGEVTDLDGEEAGTVESVRRGE